MSTDVLSHHGVKGMKWGVRKQQPTSGRSRSKKTSSSTQAIIKKQSEKSTSPTVLTDQELRNRINRIQMEKQYKDLTSSNNKLRDRGKTIAQNILFNSVERAGTAYMTHRIELAISAMDTSYNSKNAPKPKEKKDD